MLTCHTITREIPLFYKKRDYCNGALQLHKGATLTAGPIFARGKENAAAVPYDLGSIMRIAMQTLSAHFPLGQARLALSGLALFAALLLGGCGFGGSPAQPETPPGPVTGFMIASNVGETATVDDPDFGKGVRVSLDELFTSAKGEDCKRGTVLAGQREAEVIVICRDTIWRWNMAPRVWGQGLSQ